MTEQPERPRIGGQYTSGGNVPRPRSFPMPLLADRLMPQLRRIALARDSASLTDGQLLAAFIAERDPASFETLVRRHGPMVIGNHPLHRQGIKQKTPAESRGSFGSGFSTYAATGLALATAERTFAMISAAFRRFPLSWSACSCLSFSTQSISDSEASWFKARTLPPAERVAQTITAQSFISGGIPFSKCAPRSPWL